MSTERPGTDATMRTGRVGGALSAARGRGTATLPTGGARMRGDNVKDRCHRRSGDSRLPREPDIAVRVGLDTGVLAVASVPSGASTGEHEAREVRDKDAGRFGGKGVRKAAAHVTDMIAPALYGRDPMRQSEIDRLLPAARIRA